MRKDLINTMLLCVISILLVVGCQTTGVGGGEGAQTKELLPVNVKLADLSNLYTGKEAIIVDMVFTISNANPIPVKVNQLEWRVSVEKTRLGALAVPEGLYIPAKGVAQVRKTYFLNAKMGPVNLLLAGAVINLKDGAQVFGGISKAIKEERALWNLEGEAYVDSDIGSISVPFTAEFKQSPAPR